MVQEYRFLLTHEECHELINMAMDKLTQSITLGEQIDGYRTATNCWITDLTPTTEKIKDIVSTLTGLEIENQEQVHIVNYKVGGEYKNHCDFFHPNTDYYAEQMSRGGNRTHSCLFYLNDDFYGGETDFPKLGITIKPERGKLVIWDNMKPDGSLDYDSLHAGLPVTEGEKWICIIWVRENKFV